LNKIQSDVYSWIKEIRKVTELNHDLSSGTAIQEVNFWLSMEIALEAIDEKLKSDEIGIIFFLKKNFYVLKNGIIPFIRNDNLLFFFFCRINIEHFTTS